MAVRYDRLFHLLTESVERLCSALNCGVDDILEFIND